MGYCQRQMFSNCLELIRFSAVAKSGRNISYVVVSPYSSRIVSFYLARSVNLPEGLDILPMFLLCFFSLLGKPADRAIYFACVNFFLFLN